MKKKQGVDLGKKLKKLRKQNAYTIEDLKNKLLELNYPVCAKTIYKWENNEIIPDISTLKLLSIIYNVSVGSLFEDNLSCQPLTTSELSFISFLRENNNFRKIIYMITRKEKEAKIHANISCK